MGPDGSQAAPASLAHLLFTKAGGVPFNEFVRLRRQRILVGGTEFQPWSPVDGWDEPPRLDLRAIGSLAADRAAEHGIALDRLANDAAQPT